MRSEEEVRRYLRMLRALDRGQTALGRPGRVANETAALLWVLGEYHDPPGLTDVEELEELAEKLETRL